MYSITFSINKRSVVNLFMNFVISIFLKLALTVVKDVHVFCNVNSVKCKTCMVLCFISGKYHIKVRKASLKAKIMNAYFQHLLYYKSERKKLKTLTVMIVRYNIIIPFLKTGQKLLLVIIDVCLATDKMD